jgi:hypothetical protein
MVSELPGTVRTRVDGSHASQPTYTICKWNGTVGMLLLGRRLFRQLTGHMHEGFLIDQEGGFKLFATLVSA